MFLTLISLLVGILVAHYVAITLTRRFSTEPGHARQVMPTLPPNPIQEGEPEMRWNRSVRRVENRLLDRFSDGAEGVSAVELAAELGEKTELVAAALERLREQLPCRLRVTRSGRMLHDFAAADIETLQRSRRRSLPYKFLLLVFAAFANIGAAWPVLTILVMAIGTLELVLGAAGDSVYVGGVGIFLIGVVGAGTMILSWALHHALSPMIETPDLAPAQESEELPARLKGDDSAGGGWFGWFSSGSSSSSSTSSSSGSSGDSDGGGAGVGQAIVIIILIAIIILCLITIFIWLRGLWRAILKREERNLDRMSPAFWVRTAQAVDGFEKWVPTNDLVTRVYRALRRAFNHRRAVDGDLGPRILLLAKRRRGLVSAPEIALHEGLSVDEAGEVGSMLIGIVGGRIEVTDEGDLAFAYPEEALTELNPDVDEDMWAEYLDYEAENSDYEVRRRDRDANGLPVNLVGINYGHLVATDRLVGGTWLLALTGAFVLYSGGPLWSSIDAFRITIGPVVHSLPSAARLLIAGVFVLFAVGSMCLSATARYAAGRFAMHGTARDARRVAMLEIRRALESGKESLELTDLPVRIADTLAPAWNRVDAGRFETELDGVLVDLDLSPSLEGGGDYVVELDALRRRIDSADALRHEGTQAIFEASADENEVIFDTRVQHEKVTDLA